MFVPEEDITNNESVNFKDVSMKSQIYELPHYGWQETHSVKKITVSCNANLYLYSFKEHITLYNYCEQKMNEQI